MKFSESKRWTSRCNICYHEYNNILIQRRQLLELPGLLSGGNHPGEEKKKKAL